MMRWEKEGEKTHKIPHLQQLSCDAQRCSHLLFVCPLLMSSLSGKVFGNVWTKQNTTQNIYQLFELYKTRMCRHFEKEQSCHMCSSLSLNSEINFFLWPYENNFFWKMTLITFMAFLQKKTDEVLFHVVFTMLRLFTIAFIRIFF